MLWLAIPNEIATTDSEQFHTCCLRYNAMLKWKKMLQSAVLKVRGGKGCQHVDFVDAMEALLSLVCSYHAYVQP